MTQEASTGYTDLLSLARATVFEISTPSARSNLTDAIAAHAVEQYFEAIDRGEDIRSPKAWVATVARRRAIDGMRKWSKEKERNQRIDDDAWATQMYMVDASSNLISYMDVSRDAFASVHATLWINQLIESTFPDSVNREIAIRCLVDGEKPGDVAVDLGMAAPVVSNRLARIKAKLKEEISVDDLRS